MEPKGNSPEFTPQNGERAPELPNVPNPENIPETPVSPERGEPARLERAPEQAAHAQSQMAAQPVPISLPTPMPVQIDDQSAAAVDDNPAVAADEDLIEKEWVDKAKKIISETQGDPAAREKQVNRLQTDYLKKRYGKELGAAE